MRRPETAPLGIDDAIATIGNSGDTCKQYRWLRVPAAALGVGIFAGEALSNLSTVGGVVPFVCYGVTAGVASNWLARAREGRTQQRRIDKIEQAENVVRSQFSQPLDVVAMSGYSPSLRWYGFDRGYHGPGFRPDSTVFEFRRLAAIAKQYEVKKIIVSASILDHVNEDTQAKYEERIYAGRRQVYSDVIDRKSDATVLSLTAKQADQLASEVINERNVDTVDTLINMLEDNRPNHPIIKAFRAWQAENRPSEGQHKRNLEQVISNTILERIRNDSGKMLGEAPSWDQPRPRYRVHKQATLSGSKLWTASEAQVSLHETELALEGLQTLLAVAGQATIDELLTHVARAPMSPERRASQIEIALYHLIGPQSARLTPGLELDMEARAVKPTSEPLLARLAVEPPVISPTLKKYGRGKDADSASVVYGGPLRARRRIAAIFAGASVGLWGATGLHDLTSHMTTAYDKASRSVTGVQNAEGAAPNSATDSYLLKHLSPATLAELGFTHAASINDSIESKLAGIARFLHLDNLGGSNSTSNPTPPKGTNGLYLFNGSSTFGDVGKPANEALWNLTPLNGADTYGYWVQSTESLLSLSFVANDFGPAPTPPFDDLNLSTEPTPFHRVLARQHLPEAPSAQDGRPMVEVSTPGMVALNSLTAYNAPGFPGLRALRWTQGQGEVANLSVPILDGQVPIAATAYLFQAAPGSKNVYMGQQPLTRLTMPDGTSEFRLKLGRQDISPTNLMVSLNYWVQQARSERQHTVHAATPVRVGWVRGRYAPLSHVLNQEEAASVWGSLSEASGATPPSDWDRSANVIRQSHSYDFNPLYKGDVRHSIGVDAHTPLASILQSAGRAFASDKYANCNTSAFQELLISRGIGPGSSFINPTVGFHHQVGDPSALTAAQSHMWLTTNNGKRVDATPALVADNASSNAWEWDLGGALISATIALAGVVEYRRRKLGRAEAALFPDHPVDIREAIRHVEVLKAIQHADPSKPPSMSSVDDRAGRAISTLFSNGGMTPDDPDRELKLQKLYRTVAVSKPKSVLKPLYDMQAQGHYSMSPDRQKRFTRFVKHLSVLTRSRQSLK